MWPKIWKLTLKIIINFTPRVRVVSKGDVGITTIVSHNHVDILIFSIKALFFTWNASMPVNVIDDGTLMESDINKIKKHIIGVIVRRKYQNDKKIFKLLKPYKYCLKYRKEKFRDRFYIKLFDPFLLPGYKKIIYIDSDVMFLNEPDEIIKWIRSKKIYGLYATVHKYPKDTFSSSKEWYVIERMFADRICTNYPSDFSSGFMALNKSSYNLKRINDVLKYIYKIGLSDSWTPEQYSLGVLLSDIKSYDLEKKYVHLREVNQKLKKDLFSYVFLHFAYLSRNDYYKMALNLVFHTYFLRKKIND